MYDICESVKLHFIIYRKQNMCQTVNIHLQSYETISLYKSTSFFFSQVSNSPYNEINICIFRVFFMLL